MSKTNSETQYTNKGPGYCETYYIWNHPSGGFRVEGAFKDQNLSLAPVDWKKFLLGRCTAPELKAIQSSIPFAYLAEAISNLDASYETLRLAQLNETGFQQMLECNKMLLFAVARKSATHPLWGEEHWAALLSQPWTKVSQELGLPSTAPRLLQKLTATVFKCDQDIEILQTALDRSPSKRILPHLPTLTKDCLLCAAFLPTVCQSFELLFSASESQPGSTPVFEAVSTILQARQKLGLEPWPYQNVRPSESWLRKTLERLNRKLIENGLGTNSVYPIPKLTLPPFYQLVEDSEDLDWLGTRFANCAPLYHTRILAGLNAIAYNTVDDEPHVVLLQKNLSSGTWSVAYVEGSKNNFLSDDFTEYVRELFEKGGPQ